MEKRICQFVAAECALTVAVCMMDNMMKLLVAQCRCGHRIHNITTGIHYVDMSNAPVGAPVWNHDNVEHMEQTLIDASKMHDNNPAKKAGNEFGVINVGFGFICADGEQAVPILGTEMWITEPYPLREHLGDMRWRYIGYNIYRIKKKFERDTRPICYNEQHRPKRMERFVKEINGEWKPGWRCHECEYSFFDEEREIKYGRRKRGVQ